MEKDFESAPVTFRAPGHVEAIAERSDLEFENAPVHTVDWSKRTTIGLTDDQMQSAAMLFVLIILFFAGIGIALPEFTTTEPQVPFKNCLSIADDTERLSCYDKAATQSSVPFKGGSPFSIYSRPETEDAG